MGFYYYRKMSGRAANQERPSEETAQAAESRAHGAHDPRPAPAPTGLISGIETSCDETAASVVERGSRTRSNVVASQIATHAPYGGVVPELASREHLRNIVPVVRAAMREAGVAFSELDAIAVTQGPGLAGALLVGIAYAKSLAFALGKPLIAVNHLEGHIHAVLLEQRELLRTEKEKDPDLEDLLQKEKAGPLLALVVSGGHTHLYLANGQGQGYRYRNVGHTLDDAAGEAFDKVAKLLGFGYPGGPWIDALAPHGNPNAVPFTFAKIKQRRQAAVPELSGNFLFSFSGIKTAVLRYVQTQEMYPSIHRRRAALSSSTSPTPSDALALCDARTLDLIASFQRAVVDDLKQKTFQAAEALGANRLLVSGGVAANRELRVRFTGEAVMRGMSIAFPSLALSTDNAAMIAAAAWPKWLAGEFAAADLSATPSLAL
jgi:N6-L-threonylcarbamoyladenine synthase